MSSIINAAEDLAYLPFHNNNAAQTQAPFDLTSVRVNTFSNDINHAVPFSVDSLNPQIGNSGPDLEQYPNVRDHRIHRTEDNHENIFSNQLMPQEILTTFEPFRRPPRYNTKDSAHFSCAPPHSINFNARKQLISIFGHGLWRWLVTVSFVGILMLSIRHYRSQSVLSPTQVARFNAINVKVSIILGLNIASALKKMALNVRWRILSQRIRPLSECDSLIGLAKAAYIVRRPKVIMACLSILLLNLTVQIGLAALSLTYSIDSTTQAAIFKPNSPIWVTDFTRFQADPGPKLHKMLQSSIAHNRGVDGPATKSCNISHPHCQIPDPGTTRGNISTDYWRFDSYWQYILLEHPPHKQSKPEMGHSTSQPRGPVDLSVFSYQSVITNGNCRVDEAWITKSNNRTDWIFKSNNTKIEVDDRLPGSTMFVVPNAKKLSTCGNIWSTSVRAFESGSFSKGHRTNTTGWVYQCCISVNETTYPGNQEAVAKRISSKIAHIAAAAIGMQGFLTGNQSFEHQYFLDETYFGRPQNGNATGMAMLIAEFAIRVFASSGYENPMMQIQGKQPQQGSKLNINNATLMKVILLSIVGIHLTCLIASSMFVYRVAVPDFSPLGISNILYQHVGLLGGRGSLLNGQQIAEVLGDPKMIYTSVASKNGHSKQAVFELANSRQPRATFNDGVYI